jgi:segregation and condensation protein A
VVVRELELDLDAFEGPFDLLLTLVLKEELDLAEIDVAGIVLTFVERLAERGELDLEACGEFLVLVAALLELKARGLFPDEEAELSELEPEEAAEELARRLAEYRRAKEAAAWLAERLAGERDASSDRPGRPRAPSGAELASQDPKQLAATLRLLAAPPRRGLALATWHSASAGLAVPRAFFARVLRTRRRFDFDTEVGSLPRVDQAVAFLALLGCAGGEIGLERAAPLPRSGFPVPTSKGCRMDRPLRLITANPVDQLARTLEALLVVASAPLSVEELAERGRGRRRADRGSPPGLLSDRYREGRSGIVLEHVRRRLRLPCIREAAEADRLFERPVERGLSQAALETLSIVAYLGPCSRPEIARIRGVAADSAVAGLLERGLIAEAGRDDGAGAVRYRTTPLFERVFGLESAAALPRLDDLGESAAEIRERLHSVAVGKTA